MAERRMFAKTIIDSDAFLEMSLSAQALYFHLSMRADDDGFLNNAKKIRKIIGASEDDLKLLIAKRFVIAFDDGIIVIKHWRMNNYLRSDRHKPTVYQEELSMLNIKDNGTYSLKNDAGKTVGIPNAYHCETQYSIGKDSIDKYSITPLPPYEGEQPKKTSLEELIVEHNLSQPLSQAIHDWLSYKKERRFTYKEQGLKTLIKTISDKSKKHGEDKVIDLIAESISNGYQGIVWDKLSNKNTNTKDGNKFKNFEQRQRNYDDLEKAILGRK